MTSKRYSCDTEKAHLFKRAVRNNFGIHPLTFVKFTINVTSCRGYHCALLKKISVFNTCPEKETHRSKCPTFSLCATHFLKIRYVELNTRCSGRYKRYNRNIPKYLQDKPRQCLYHCMNRIYAAEEISSDGIREGKSKGEFHVASAESKDRYQLSFSGDG